MSEFGITRAVTSICGTGRYRRSVTNRLRPRLEPLEDRQLFSTCHVTRLSDTGIGKGFRGDLRYCINKVNAEPGPDVIDFTVTGTINLTSELPALSTDINIQGPVSDQLTVQRSVGQQFRIFTVPAGTQVEVSSLTVQNGYTPIIGGGGIYNAGTLTLVNVAVYGNRAGGDPSNHGGGILNDGTLVLQASLVAVNQSVSSNYTAQGGGIHNRGDLTVIDSIISSNNATSIGWGSHGGGIYNSGSAAIYNSAFVSNRALGEWGGTGSGGAITNVGSLVIVNSTLAFNEASFKGSCLEAYGFTVVSHSTIHGNVGSPAVELGNSVFMRNTIVAGNANNDIGGGPLAASGYNLIGDSTGGSGYAPTDILDVDPLLGSLDYNGGLTQTMFLLPGGPAIDAGDNTDAPEWDQRGPGFPRIVNGTIDIGAFEVQASPTPSSGGIGRPVLSDNQLSADLPRSGFITQPRVAERTLGMQTDPTPTLKGLHLDDAIQPLRGISMVAISNPGCAARPWAVICNPFGVSEDVMLEVDMPA